MNEFNDWFMSLPEGRQAALRDDKWRLSDAAFQAGFAQAKAENERLIAINAELADLAGSTVGMLQGGGWLALADEIKDAIAKVDAPKGYARLIAAAPDLLSALKAMIDEHEPLTSSACDLQRKVLELIDKVEGESA